MPIFEYQCRDCDRPFELFVTADRKPACPSCGGANLVKLLSAPGMVGASGSVAAEDCAASAEMCGARGSRCGCQ